MTEPTESVRESDEALIERIEGMLHLNEAIGIPAREGSTIGLCRDTLSRLLKLARRGATVVKAHEATGKEARVRPGACLTRPIPLSGKRHLSTPT